MLTRRGLLRSLLGLGAATLSFAAYGIGIEPILRLDVARYALTPPGWPPQLKLRIVALADVHACDPWMPLARVKAIVAQANALGGDVMLLLGDYVTGRRLPHRALDPAVLAASLAVLRAPLGVHAILGNHDWWDDRAAMRSGQGPTYMHRRLEEAGLNVLENDAIRLRHAGHAFWLAGLGDQIAFQTRRAGLDGRRRPLGVDDLPKLLRAIDDDAPAILLAHEPDIFPQVPDRFALTLSGHTHGGQVNLFGWRPAAASELSGRYARGHFHERGRDLIVSSGLGCSLAPVRFGVPPEILVVDLGG